jgi:hypothetical protein
MVIVAVPGEVGQGGRWLWSKIGRQQIKHGILYLFLFHDPPSLPYSQKLGVFRTSRALRVGKSMGVWAR